MTRNAPHRGGDVGVAQDAGPLQVGDHRLAQAVGAFHGRDFYPSGEVGSRAAVKEPRMEPQVSQNAFDQFFGWAPLIIGIVIYAIFYVAKRRETSPNSGMPIGQTFACANCGRRGVREHMVPQEHGGAVSWFCHRCAGH